MENLETSKYELMAILLPDLGEESTKKEMDVIRSLITENGGEIFNEDIWGIKELAYRIKKQDEGFYFVFNFSMPSLKVKNLEDPLNLNQKVLRYLLLSLPKSYEIKTLAEYEKEAEKEREEEAKKKEEKEEKKRPARKPIEKPKAKSKKPIEKHEQKVSEKEEKEISVPKKEEKKTSASKLSEVDEKLKNIINDPDISL